VTDVVVTAQPNAVVTSPAQASEPTARTLDRVRAEAPVALVLLACAWWLIVAPRLEGGRGAGAVAGGAILTALATLAVQPHRFVPRGVIWLALAVSGGALGVAVLAPTGWAGATTAASYVCASWLVVSVAAAAVRDPRVPNLLLLLFVAAVLVEIGESWLAWWGGSSAGHPFIGTFYWWNPFAAFLITGTVVGLSLWLRRSGPVAAFGLMAGVLGTIGVVYSTSRASGACFVVAVVVVCVFHVAGRGLAGLRRVLIALAGTAFAVWAIAGPPFFAHRVLPFSGTSARATGQSLGQNGGYRLDFWREALGVFHRYPLTGAGYHSLASASVGHDPHGWPLSPLAHSGYLQALSDGGLLLALPFFLAAAFITWWVVSALVSAVRRKDFSTAALAVPLCLGALLAHSAVDFDWSYPADFAVVAILAGLVGAARWTASEQVRTGIGSRVTAVFVLVGVALLGISAGAAWSGDISQSLPIGHSSTSGGSA
jgi:O-antigen ligase